MKVLIDLNVILDVVLKRQPWMPDSIGVWNAHSRGQIQAQVVATNLTNLFYIVTRFQGRTVAMQAVLDCLQTFSVIGVDETMLIQAAALPGTDYEDNVQIAAAVSGAFDAIITRDLADFATSKVPAMTPTDLLAKLASNIP